MSVISKIKILKKMKDKELVLTPLLDKNQIRDIVVDLRLGKEFKVSRQTRKAYVSVEDKEHYKFFDSTQREFGEDFILFPGQLVLANTFEYIKLPKNITGQLTSKSSINRLGVTISSIVQPGYYGTLTLELLNNGENPIKLKVGMKIVQLMLLDTEEVEEEVLSKYNLSISPTISKVSQDLDLEKLKNF